MKSITSLPTRLWNRFVSIFRNENDGDKETASDEKNNVYINNEISAIRNSLSDIHTALDAISSEQAALSERFTNSSRENAEDLKKIKGTVLKIAKMVDSLSVPQENEPVLPENPETIRKIRDLTIQMVDCLAFAAENGPVSGGESAPEEESN